MIARSFSRLVCIRLKYSYDLPPVQALCSSNLPKLLERDTPLFIAILGDLFPRKALPLPSHDTLHRGVAAAAKEMGLQPLEEQMTKVDQLHETMEVLSGLRFSNQGCQSFRLRLFDATSICGSIAQAPTGQELPCRVMLQSITGLHNQVACPLF